MAASAAGIAGREAGILSLDFEVGLLSVCMGYGILVLVDGIPVRNHALGDHTLVWELCSGCL